MHACLPVHQCINTLTGNDENEGQNFSILSDNEISTQICDEQKFMPNRHFECTQENEIEISQTDLDEEFFDCSETMDFDQNCVNVMTRQQSKLATGQATASDVDHTDQQDTSQDSPLTQVNTDTASADSQTNDTQQQVNTDQSDQGNSADTEPMHTESPVNSDSQVIIDGLDLDITPGDYLADPEFASMYHFKSTGILPTDDKAARTVMLTHDLYTIEDEDNRLYKLTIPRSKRERTVKPLQKQLCLPLKYQRYSVEFVHRVLSHPSTERLYLTLKDRYYCRNLFDLARSISATCSDCQQCKRDYAQVNAPLHPHPVQGFMEQWHIDHVNLCRPTPSGHKYLLVCIETYSCWPEVYPVFTTSSLETAKCMVDLIGRWGVMKRIISDRGTSFSSQLFKQIAKTFGIHHKMIASLSPKSNAKAERYIGILKSNLRVMCETDDQIVDRLPLVLLGMRGTVSSVTHVSPYMAIYGRSMPLPIPGCDLNTPQQPSERLRIAEKEFLEKVRVQLDELETKVKQNIAADKEEVRRTYDARFKTKPVNFKLGDQVWLLDRGAKAHSPSVLTRSKYIGPFYITAIPPSREGEGVAYFLTHSVTGKRLKHPVGPHRLKVCTTDRAELKAKYPGLDYDSQVEPQVDTLGHSTAQTQQSSTSGQDSTTQITPQSTTPDRKQQDTTGQQTQNAPYCPAIAITRQRYAPDGLEFCVKFHDNTLEWVHQSRVSPALKADFLIKKHNRARSRLRN